jgi:hypothetical protein
MARARTSHESKHVLHRRTHLIAHDNNPTGSLRPGPLNNYRAALLVSGLRASGGGWLVGYHVRLSHAHIRGR